MGRVRGHDAHLDALLSGPSLGQADAARLNAVARLEGRLLDRDPAVAMNRDAGGLKVEAIQVGLASGGDEQPVAMYDRAVGEMQSPLVAVLLDEIHLDAGAHIDSVRLQ